MKTVILIDSCSDLPLEYIEENNIPYVSLTYQLEGIEYPDNFWKGQNAKNFYDALRNGGHSTTSQVNLKVYYDEFKKYVELEKSIIYIGFSSALSGSTSNALMAREQILEEYKDADITIIDSKSASLGLGLLVHYAYKLLKQGHSKEEIVNWIEDNKLKVNHWFTVEDLHHLKRGGRISSTAAVVGTLLNIKPLLYVNNEGKLTLVEKTKGRKKALRTLVEKLEERIIKPEEQIIAISHGDCIEDAEHVKELILEQYNVKEIIINNIGPVIGAHTGAGIVALFFMGNARE